MWRPESLGDVIAERVCDLQRGGRKVGRVTIKFGRPVRDPQAEPRDPWWCPVRIFGSGIDAFHAIAGEDSLQALILGLEFAADILPHEAKSLRARLDWLGQPENLILARQGEKSDPENAFAALLARLARERSDLPGRSRPTLRAVGGASDHSPIRSATRSAPGPDARPDPRQRSSRRRNNPRS
jgi:hypothetical protein